MRRSLRKLLTAAATIAAVLATLLVLVWFTDVPEECAMRPQILVLLLIAVLALSAVAAHRERQREALKPSWEELEILDEALSVWHHDLAEAVKAGRATVDHDEAMRLIGVKLNLEQKLRRYERNRLFG